MTDRRSSKPKATTSDELDRGSDVISPLGGGRGSEGERRHAITTKGSCPLCALQQLAIVGLHWVQARKREDGYPEEHVHLACLSPGCGFQDCAVADAASLPESLYIDAVGAEMALARTLEYQDYDPDEDPPGVVRGYQVRWSIWPEAELVVHEEDADDDIFVLVTGTTPVFEVRGWIAGGKAKQERFLRPHAQ